MDSWRSIDNTGKIFPATSNRRDTRVFRLYSVLKEDIDPEKLQLALDKTMEQYPLFRSVIRKGFFWYYLEKSDIEPVVSEESKHPCSSIYVRDKKSLLFEVTYWKNKINFEVFHALTDGTGAVEFIRELTKNYICIVHQLEDVVLRDQLSTEGDFEQDSFDKYYEHPKEIKKEKQPKTHQIHGMHCELGTMKLQEHVFSTKALLEKAREYQVSITVLLTAVFICAIHEERNLRNNRPIGIMIPVNLRKYFPSDTMMNFFGWISPYHDFAKDGAKFEDVLETIKRRFQQGLERENVLKRMNDLVKIEKNPFLRGIPLELKIIGLRLAASFSTGEITAVYSNVGAIQLPEQISDYVERFGFFVSTPKIQICSCSYKDEFTVGITSSFENENIQRNFVRIMKHIGIEDKGTKTEYPEESKKPFEGILFVKIFTFAMIAMVVLTLAVYYVIKPAQNWPLYTVLLALCMWIISTTGYFKRKNLFKNAIWQQMIVSFVCVLWDWLTGWNTWSIGVAIPVLNCVMLLSMVVVSFILKEPIKKNMIYFILTELIGVVPAVFVMLRILTFPYIALFGAVISFLSLSATLIFKWSDVKYEVRKKFHW